MYLYKVLYATGSQYVLGLFQFLMCEMYLKNWPSWCFLLISSITTTTKAADDDYNIIHRDGSFQFGYDNPNSYHHAVGNRNNVVRGEFGGRNPGTGRIDSTQYTAGPRGYRPRGKNIHRKYDLNQNGPRPVGSPDDPYYDPYEDPSYNFEFKTRTYNRQESANRAGDVAGRYEYLDDVGERHEVKFIAGKNTGFHVRTPFPDSKPEAYYGRFYYKGRGKPIPRGRTSIQRGLDGSYRFVSAGPDQRRTETSDASGHVRGSYTYLDDKGVQHSVHYIAGPETGYRVLKNVKGAHLPTVYPFGRPEIIPPDFYDYGKEDVFDTAASGHVKPINNNVGGVSRPDKDKDSSDGSFGPNFESDLDKPGEDNLPSGATNGAGDNDGDSLFNRPPSGGGSNKPQSDGAFNKPPKGPSQGGFNRPGYQPPLPNFSDAGEDSLDIQGELFGPPGSKPGITKPTRPPRPTGDSSVSGGVGGAGSTGEPSGGGPDDDGSYKPSFEVDDGTYIPPGDVNQDDGSYKPGLDEGGLGFGGGESPQPGLGGDTSGRPSRLPGGSTPGESTFTGKPVRPPGGSRPGDSAYGDDYDDTNGLFGSESNSRPPLNGRPPIIQIQGGSGRPDCKRCAGTIVTNVGDRSFLVPPGVSVRAHVQSIDLLPLVSKVPSPSEQYNQEMNIKTEQLNSAASDLVSTNSTVTELSSSTTVTTTAVPTTTSVDIETTTINE